MADLAGGRFVLPVHHQTFKLSAEGFGEPIRRFEAALAGNPSGWRGAAVGETFLLPE